MSSFFGNNSSLPCSSSKPKCKSQSQKLTEIANCFICRNRYNNDSRAPIGIPCGHTFCRTCVNNKVESNTILCVKCNKVSVIGFSGLNKNIVFLQYLEKLNLLTEDDKVKPELQMNANNVSKETLKNIKLGFFNKYCQFLMKFVKGYIDCQLDAPNVCQNVELISDIRKTVDQIDIAEAKLTIGLEALQNQQSDYYSFVI